MWSNRRTLGLKCLLLGLMFALGCSGKTVKNDATGIEPTFEAGVAEMDAMAGLLPEAGLASSSVPTATTTSEGSETASTTTTNGTSSTPPPPTTSSSSVPTSSEQTLTSDDPTSEATKPGFWKCFTTQYGDGVCNCGCGIPDVDCAGSDDIDMCEGCTGGCNATACPGRIDPEDTTQCIRVSPLEWTCGDTWYQDGTCHCGCGVPDPDCASAGVESCEVCGLQGSCATASCPGSIDPEDNTKCWVPEDWTCLAAYFGDGLCNCGCGALDIDCPSASRDVCITCIGCNHDGCPGAIDAEDNRICTGVPYAWRCDDRYYNDGQLCNCGCGVTDPDCNSAGLEACDACDYAGSCSIQECPGTIHPTDNAYCQQPTAPPEWTCGSYQYAEGYSCDCGCGAPDLDCVSDEVSECDSCCGSYCPNRINPEDTTQCLTVPEEWRCGEWAYADGNYCDCGCGILDPDCPAATSDVCQTCSSYYGGCARNNSCDNIVPDDNTHCTDEAPPEWTCNPEYFGDGDACDCGCGVLDLDCGGELTLGACDICNAEGSCSIDGCNDNDWLDPENNATCLE